MPGASERGTSTHIPMGKRPGRRRGLRRASSPPWDPASPASPLPRGRPGCGLSGELKGLGGKEKQGAAREEPPEGAPRAPPGSAGRTERHLRRRRRTEHDAGAGRAGSPRPERCWAAPRHGRAGAPGEAWLPPPLDQLGWDPGVWALYPAGDRPSRGRTSPSTREREEARALRPQSWMAEAPGG